MSALKIITCGPEMIPVRRSAFAWMAFSADYDGAEDSATRNQIGFGRTEAEAIADLREKLGDK